MVSELYQAVAELNLHHGLEICFDDQAEIYGEEILDRFAENLEDVVTNIEHLISLGFGEDVSDICNRFGIVLLEQPAYFAEKVARLIAPLGKDYVQIMGEDMSYWEALL
jgi:hypothetical protein